ncbi:Rho guanine nucleotide exchange factor 7 [Armadillidium vulgare]|nr:Rho guanine nucleotide exchange factor 7 [Armadillidium vulgare]
MANENGILLVQALYPFTGKNNDELCFKKGDLIIVTQKEDGGWWEGTLNENTGWFPSNYVKEHKAIVDGTANHIDADSPPLSPQQTQQQILYRSMVSKEIVESERNHVKELQNFYTKYLTALQSSDIISDSEFKQLTGNLEEIISVHNRLLSLLEEQFELSAKEQRIGGTFLKIAPSLQNAHKIYIANHPKAVCIIEKFKDELNSFMECHGATRPGVLVLTTALSQPFRRLDKYPGVLQEFQRHMEESHPDRGDTQRSTHVFRDLAGKYQLNSIAVNKLEDGSQYKNAFEITGTQISKIVAICQSSSDQQQWVEILSHHVNCAKNVPLGSRKNSSSFASPPPSLPAHHSHLPECIFVSRPYAILTKYFGHFYRKNVITKTLLRSLIGIIEDREAASKVMLRTHRSECSLDIRYSANSDTDARSLENINHSLQVYTLTRRKRVINKEEEMGILSPLPSRKEYNLKKSNLQKWKFQNLDTDRSSFESQSCLKESSFSSVSEFNIQNNVFIPSDTSEFFIAPITSQDFDFDDEKEKNRETLRKMSNFKHSNNQNGNHCLFSEINKTDSTSSTYNVCNKTIYESSSEETINQEREMLLSRRKVFPFKSKKLLTCYFSSCSGDEEFSLNDYYEIPRKQTYHFSPRSKSEPDIRYSSFLNLTEGKKMPNYQSHFVQIVADLRETQDNACKCKTHSFRSSDSGLADVINHNECCMHRFETPVVFNRASPSRRLSRRSHSPSLRSGRYRSSLVRHVTPEANSECDSLLPASITPTPCCTPCTSAPPSCVIDSSVSILEAAALASPYSNVNTESTYKSGLYAHWWMKASVCPKMLVSSVNSDNSVFSSQNKILSPKVCHMKPSWHRLSRSSKYRSCRQVYPYISLPQDNSNEESTEPSTSENFVAKEKSGMTHLGPQESLLCRDPSFESQGSQLSQVTIIRKINDHNSSSFGSGQIIQRSETQNTSELLTPQLSVTTIDSGGYTDISSMHSFNESEEGAGEMSFLRDFNDDQPLNFNRQGSSHSDICPSSSLSPTYRSTLNLSFNPVFRISNVDDESKTSDALDNSSDDGMAKLNPYREIVRTECTLPFHRSKSLPQSLFLNINKGTVPLVLPHHNTSTSKNEKLNIKPWSLSCLRPSPPLRPGFSLRDDKKKTKKKDESWHEDDALILRVIEYYCTSAKTRYTVNSIDLGQVGRSCHSSGGGQNTPLPSCLASTPTSPPLSPFGDMRMIKGGDSNWCCGLAMKAIKRNIDLDC